MIITYERDNPNMGIEGKSWKAHRWTKNNDTLIIDSLWDSIKGNNHLNFVEICEVVKFKYKNSKLRSRVSISVDRGVLEIIRKGVFPSILIDSNA